MVDKITTDSIVKDYLTKTAGLNEKEADKIIKGFHKEVKEAYKEQKKEIEKEEKEERKREVRHGTTCVGIIDKEHNKRIIEW